MSTALEIVASESILTEIEQINQQLSDAERTFVNAGKAALSLYRLLGDRLSTIRQDPSIGGYGKWLPWLKAHGIDENRAKRAMRIANPNNWQKLEAIAADNQSEVTDFTLTEALGYLVVSPKTPALTFEHVKESFKPWGNFVVNDSGAKFRYALDRPGGAYFFDSLEIAMQWYESRCNESNRLAIDNTAILEPPPQLEKPHQHKQNHQQDQDDIQDLIVHGVDLYPDDQDDQTGDSEDQTETYKTTGSSSIFTSSKTDEHYTPQEILDAVYRCFEQHGGVGLDPCSNAIGRLALPSSEGSPHVTARKHYTIADDGLFKPWDANTIYVNPPYSNVSQWVDKVVQTYDSGSIDGLLLLVKSDPSTQWFQKIWFNATAVCFINHRLKFINESNLGGAAQFASAVAYFGSEIDRFYRAFEHLGVIVQVINPDMFGE